MGGEEIIATPTHPFYCPTKGWTDAAQLRAGDILVLVNGEYVVVEKVQHELLESPVKVYNFQVEDIRNHKVVPLEYGAYLKSSGGKILPYLGAAYAVSNTIYAAFCNDPVARAAERGYMLK